MDWKPSHDERSYIGTYTMGLGSPRAVYERSPAVDLAIYRYSETELIDMRRNRAVFRVTPVPGLEMPRWCCIHRRVGLERYPTNWGLPRAKVVEHACAAKGDPACVWEVRWKNLPLGWRFWAPILAGAVAAVAMSAGARSRAPPGVDGGNCPRAVPCPGGGRHGAALLERRRRLETRRLLDIQAEEILHSNQQLERKFRDLETKIEQLSLLSDLAAAVNATLDPEKIYEQALQRLIHGMGYQGAHLLLVDSVRQTRARASDGGRWEPGHPLRHRGVPAGRSALRSLPGGEHRAPARHRRRRDHARSRSTCPPPARSASGRSSWSPSASRRGSSASST